MNYETCVTIVLTATGVILAALGLIIAIAAIWGYKSIKEAAMSAAEKAVENSVKRAVEEQFKLESLTETIQNIVDEKMEIGLGIADGYIEDKLSLEKSNIAPIADEYPEGGKENHDEDSKPI